MSDPPLADLLLQSCCFVNCSLGIDLFSCLCMTIETIKMLKPHLTIVVVDCVAMLCSFLRATRLWSFIMFLIDPSAQCTLNTELCLSEIQLYIT